MLWWQPAGTLPTLDDGLIRLRRLVRDGPTQAAFTFRDGPTQAAITFRARFEPPTPSGRNDRDGVHLDEEVRVGEALDHGRGDDRRIW